MKNIVRKAAFVGAVFLVSGGIAQATQITFEQSLDRDSVPTSSVSGVRSVDFNSGLCGYASCTGNYEILSDSVLHPGPYTGSRRDPTKFLSVVGVAPATFGLGQSANYFGLLWGSADPGNLIRFLDGRNVVASYNGASIFSGATDGSQSLAASNRYVNFFNLPSFITVEFSSSTYGFESDNHTFGNVSFRDVPEPGSLAMFALGLCGLGWLVRRRQGKPADSAAQL
ncbi:PEP-CTERM sorting domain-containing protein [Salinisphaera sp. Q1T1-3]|uniref:Npun_F0296 family exosortase-dependent surface protein n=1 Tax=Salinisphaera sp. Q1T1-3 TaxID=2321229 RepID=UPI001313E809|nr:PEP-CTERM sorting domain-containing protein [Salinisphaera sp. Q1T1-3]